MQRTLTSPGVGVPGGDKYACATERLEEQIQCPLTRQVDVIELAGVPPIVTRGWGAEDGWRAS